MKFREGDIVTFSTSKYAGLNNRKTGLVLEWSEKGFYNVFCFNSAEWGDDPTRLDGGLTVVEDDHILGLVGHCDISAFYSHSEIYKEKLNGLRQRKKEYERWIAMLDRNISFIEFILKGDEATIEQVDVKDLKKHEEEDDK